MAWALVLLLAWAAPAGAVEVKGEVNGGGLNLRVHYKTPGSSSRWAVEVRDGAGQVWPGMLLGPQGQVWARLPGMDGTPGPRLEVRHTASGEQARVSSGRRVSLDPGGGGDWWLLESDARGWVDQVPAPYTPAPGQQLWAYTYLPKKGSLGRNSRKALINGDSLNLASPASKDLGLVTTVNGDHAVGLLSGPSAVTTLTQAREALASAPAELPSSAQAVTPTAPVEVATTLPTPANSSETKEKSGMPEYVCVILGLIVFPLAAWLMGRMVFRATWGRMSPYKGVAVGMAVFWVLLAIAEYWIWVGAREPREALLQLTLSVGLPSLFSWTVILSNIFRRLRD